MFTRIFLCLSALLMHAMTPVYANEYLLKQIKIDHPYAHTSLAQHQNGAAYLTINNLGPEDDTLISATSPVARTVEIHRMEMSQDNMMKMRSVPHLLIKSHTTLALKSGGDYHLMLLNLRHPLKEKEQFPLTLKFEKSGAITVMVWVE